MNITRVPRKFKLYDCLSHSFVPCKGDVAISHDVSLDHTLQLDRRSLSCQPANLSQASDGPPCIHGLCRFLFLGGQRAPAEGPKRFGALVGTGGGSWGG
jgi:hypothetical protein